MKNDETQQNNWGSDDRRSGRRRLDCKSAFRLDRLLVWWVDDSRAVSRRAAGRAPHVGGEVKWSSVCVWIHLRFKDFKTKDVLVPVKLLQIHLFTSERLTTLQPVIYMWRRPESLCVCLSKQNIIYLHRQLTVIQIQSSCFWNLFVLF